jgi:prepilin-type N-terminal cleavage/methylation domain-containing protein
MMILRRLGLLNKNQRGFTLIEMLIVLAISGIVTGTTTMTIFQVLDGNVRTNNHMEAISHVQNAGYQVSIDAEQAQTVVRTEDPDGFPLTLTWTDWENNDQYQAIYSITNNKLQRQYYKNGNLIGTPYEFEYIFNTDPDDPEEVPITYCTLINNTLSCTLTAIAGGGSQKQIETRVYEVIPRPSM